MNSQQEFNRRRSLIEYTFCNDQFIWDEMRKEEEEANKPKPEVVQPVIRLNEDQLASRINPFLLDTFKNKWDYSQKELDLAKQNLKPEMISPSHIYWNQRRQDIDPGKSGQYTLNPETQNIDFEKAKVFIPDRNELKAFEDKTLAEVSAYINIKYSNKYYIPGIEYWQYICQNPDKAPASLKDTKNYYFYFGSILRYCSGDWSVPCSSWSGSSFGRYTFGFGNGWYSSHRVVLLER